jgi:hypothetical protein
MAYYLVKDFIRGLDVRRLQETQEAGALIQADNCVITRGGEVERRKSFGAEVFLSAITEDSRGLFVKDEDVWDKFTVFVDSYARFADGWQESATSQSVRVIELPHPDPDARLQRVCSVRLVRNKLFVSAEFNAEPGRFLSYYGASDTGIAIRVTENIVIDQTTTDEDGEIENDTNWPSIGNGRAHTSFTLNVQTPQEVDDQGNATPRSLNIYATNFSMQDIGRNIGLRFNGIINNRVTIFQGDVTGDTNEQVAVDIAKQINADSASGFAARAAGAVLWVSSKELGERYNGYSVFMNAGAVPWLVMDPTASVMDGGVEALPDGDLLRKARFGPVNPTFPPIIESLEPSANSILIRWRASTNSEQSVWAHYSTSTGGYSKQIDTGLPASRGTYNLQGLEADTLYYVGLSLGSINIIPSPPNPAYSAQTTGGVIAPPSSPDVLSAVAADGVITAEIEVIEGATGYVLYAEDLSSAGEIVLESNTTRISGVQSGVYYNVYAKARNAGGLSARGKMIPNVFYVAADAQAPDSVTNLSVSYDFDGPSITVRWGAAPANGAPVEYLVACDATDRTWVTSSLNELITDPAVLNAAELNGAGIVFTVTPSNAIGIGPASSVTLAQQDNDLDYTALGVYKWFNPAKFALQVDQKVYGVADDRWTQSFDEDGNPSLDSEGNFVINRQDSSLLNVSAINQPSEWSPDADGAGFIDFSFYGGDSSNLQSLAQFGNRLAVFAKKSVYLWNVDPDLARSNLSSVVDNTGTFAPRSVVSWGNRDVFYLDLTGVRSLNSREVTGAAFSSDIGTPIDQLVQESVEGCFDERYITACMEPRDGRYTISIPQKSGGTDLFCFTYFASSKISAWTRWQVNKRIEVLTNNGSDMYVRTDDNLIMRYGSGDEGHECTVQLPYLSAGKPATMKDIHAIDIAAKGDWHIDYSVTPDMDTPIFETVGMVEGTSYRQQRIAIQNYAPQVSFRLKTSSEGAKLGNLAWHYRDGEEAS